MTDALFELSPGAGQSTQWHGVYSSSFGKHLVLVTRNAPARLPEFTEVRSMVLQDVMAEQLRARKAEFISRVVGEYRIDIAADLKRGATP